MDEPSDWKGGSVIHHSRETAGFLSFFIFSFLSAEVAPRSHGSRNRLMDTTDPDGRKTWMLTPRDRLSAPREELEVGAGKEQGAGGGHGRRSCGM